MPDCTLGEDQMSQWGGAAWPVFIWEGSPAFITATASFFPLRSSPGSKHQWPSSVEKRCPPTAVPDFLTGLGPKQTLKRRFSQCYLNFRLANEQPGCQVPYFPPTNSVVPEILRLKPNALISVKIQEGTTWYFYFVLHSFQIIEWHVKCEVLSVVTIWDINKLCSFIPLSWRSSLNQMPDLDCYYPRMNQEKFEMESQPK